MSETATVVLDPQQQIKAHRYATLRRRLSLTSWALSAAYLGAWVAFGWGLTFERVIQSLASNWTGAIPWWIVLLAVAAALGLPFGLLYLPVEYYAGFVLPHRFQLSTQTLAGWVTDMAKGAVLSVLIGCPLLIGLYALMRLSPGGWWLWAAVGYSAVSVVLSALAPVILMPIFFKFRPLDEAHAELNERLLALTRRARTRVRGVFTFDMSRRTRAANAALVGLGRTRRVILGDTLLSEFEPEEIETVLAHELGHHVHLDIPLFILVQTGFNLLTFFLIATGARWAVPDLGLSSLADPGGLPAVALLAGVLTTIVGPVANAFSRWREALADRYALELTHNRGAFASAMTRLANQNLAEADPPGWAVLLFATHPPLGQRIRTAHQFNTDSSG
jgi:STE24 endopeptidase